MWQIIAVPAYVWCLVALHFVFVAILARLRRRAIWIPMLAFSLTVLVIGATEGFYTIYVMKTTEHRSPEAQLGDFEISLVGFVLVALFGLLLFGGGLAVLKRRGFYPTPVGVYFSAALGAAWVAIPGTFSPDDGNTATVVFWLWAILLPIVSARLALRRTLQATGS